MSAQRLKNITKKKSVKIIDILSILKVESRTSFPGQTDISNLCFNKDFPFISTNFWCGTLRVNQQRIDEDMFIEKVLAVVKSSVKFTRKISLPESYFSK